MRRIKRSQLTMTLFPFMDVLTGVIGVLVLIICTLALLGVNQSTIIFDVIAGSKAGNPVFLECRDDRLLVHGEATEEILLGESPNLVLQQLVERLSTQRYKKNRFLLNVRPSGILTFESLRVFMDQAQLPYGFEPTPSNQKIKVRIKGKVA